MNIQDFKTLPILAILRGISARDIRPIVETSVSAGLKTVEITMNTDNACGLIRDTVKEAAGRLTVGAGTVLSVDDVKRSADAGAVFIVSPVFQPEVVSYCRANGLPVFPGALTPQEIYDAWEGGASMVKVFPSKFFGPSYFREIKGPLHQVELLACGGVTADNVGEFFRCGASAVAFGASIFRKEWIAERRFDLIGGEIKMLIEHFEMSNVK